MSHNIDVVAHDVRRKISRKGHLIREEDGNYQQKVLNVINLRMASLLAVMSCRADFVSLRVLKMKQPLGHSKHRTVLPWIHN